MPGDQNAPLNNKEEIRQHPDQHIDQDFRGFPDGNASEETIKPSTKEEEKTADIGKKDGEKINIAPEERKSVDEQDSDGSANAFEDK